MILTHKNSLFIVNDEWLAKHDSELRQSVLDDAINAFKDIDESESKTYSLNTIRNILEELKK